VASDILDDRDAQVQVSGEPVLSVCIAVGPNEPIESVLETIESVLSQEHREVEIVVKTFGDHLEQVLGPYASNLGEGRARLIGGRDSGIYDAFNICIAAARGRYIMFLGCGDILAHRRVVNTVAAQSTDAEASDALYGGVVLRSGSGQAEREFDTRCFLGNRARLPWRNPCHHQGLIYRRSWLAERPFRTDIGPLADLVHNYQHRIFDRARWLNEPVSVFRTGGASTQIGLSASVRRMRAVLVNCEFFRFPSAWKAISIAVLTLRYLVARFRRA
jgi:glycosyltransferase involved in cell wall biosynthesis